MKLIILHGPPASGKLTLARALEKELSYKVLHNHLTVDLALEVYPEFGGDDFFQFTDHLRSLCIDKACMNKIEGLIVTFCFDVNYDKDVVSRWVDIVEGHNGIVIPIYLNTSVETLKKRVTNQSRLRTKKIQTIKALDEVIIKNNFGPIQEPIPYQVDTNDKSVSETLDDILKILK